MQPKHVPIFLRSSDRRIYNAFVPQLVNQTELLDPDRYEENDERPVLGVPVPSVVPKTARTW
jgi:hypothetical protein